MAGLSWVNVPGRHQRLGELGPLLVGAGAPVDPVGLGQLGDLVDEVDDALVGGGVGDGGLRVGGHACSLSRFAVPPAGGALAGRRAHRRCVVE